MKNKKVKQILLLAFIIVQTLAYLFLNFAKLDKLHYLSYGIVCLCLVFVILFASKNLNSTFMILAFIFTLIADYFLVLRGGKNKTLAMCFFMLAQIFYACVVYFLAFYPKERLLQLGTRIIVTIVSIIVASIILKDRVEPLYIISVAYYFNMLISIAFSLIHFKEGLSVKLFAIGLILFSLCDISIGLTVVVDIFNLTESNFICKILNLPINYVNLFYPISQIVIACSFMEKDLKKVNYSA